MGILETLAIAAGAGLVMYYSYGIILSKLNQQQVPPLAPFTPPPAQTPVSTPNSPSTNTITEPTKEKEKPISKPKSEPIVLPTTSEMTSPDVAGTSFTFNVVGDIDYFEGTGQNLCGDNPTVALIIGDFDYGKPCNPQKWWTTTMKPCNGKKNLGSVGNHDCNGKGFLELFPLNGGKWEFTYKVGNIAFIAVNTGFCSARCMNPSTSEPLFKQAQADPSVKFIVAHFHKPIFTTGTAPDAPMELHHMMKKYPKVKMAFAGHNHSYRRFAPIEGIQYITAGAGGHDKTKGSPVTKGPSSGSVGVVKCRVDSNGGMSCQYVANSGEVLDSWGLTAEGRHTGTGGISPKGGSTPSESGYARAFFAQLDSMEYPDKETRDNAFLHMMDTLNARLYPQRQFNNVIYHYSRRYQ